MKITEDVIFHFIYQGHPKRGLTYFTKDIIVNVPINNPCSGIYEALAKKGPNQDEVPDWQMGFYISYPGEDTQKAQQFIQRVSNFTTPN